MTRTFRHVAFRPESDLCNVFVTHAGLVLISAMLQHRQTSMLLVVLPGSEATSDLSLIGDRSRRSTTATIKCCNQNLKNTMPI